jgi:hypothetical protein
MKRHSLFCILFFIVTLSGCVSIEPKYAPTAPPQKEFSYVAGKFTRTHSGGFAFILRNADSGIEYPMSLGEDTALPSDGFDQVVAIKVPPGKYVVSDWVTYGTLTKERSKKHPIKDSILNVPFTIEAGSVMFLGNYSANTSVTRGYPAGTINYSITPSVAIYRDSRDAFLKAYPLFNGSAFKCLSCSL